MEPQVNWSIEPKYPPDYRAQEVKQIVAAVSAGDCAQVVGLSGSGKSNLLRFLAGLSPSKLGAPSAFVDGNRLLSDDVQAFFRLLLGSIGEPSVSSDSLQMFADSLHQLLVTGGSLCLIIDRFDALPSTLVPVVSRNLRAFRDAHKYRLTYVIASRRRLDPHHELAELFFANTIWLGPLAEGDASWAAQQFALRRGLAWNREVIQALVSISQGYPAFLRAACEAYAGGAELTLGSISVHPAVQQRVNEFWADNPSENDLRLSGLQDHPFLERRILQESSPGIESDEDHLYRVVDQPGKDMINLEGLLIDSSRLTAKEYRLLIYFLSHPGEVCEKDNLIRAVWSEDKIFIDGIRDDSLAQLVRRLRKKIELDPEAPRYITTVPGRGYRFIGGNILS